MLRCLCPGCRQPITAPAESAGRVVRCPRCKQSMTLPSATATTAPPPTVKPSPPPLPSAPPSAALVRIFAVPGLLLGLAGVPVSLVMTSRLLGIVLLGVGAFLGVVAFGLSVTRRGEGLGFALVALAVCGSNLLVALALKKVVPIDTGLTLGAKASKPDTTPPEEGSTPIGVQSSISAIGSTRPISLVKARARRLGDSEKYTDSAQEWRVKAPTLADRLGVFDPQATEARGKAWRSRREARRAMSDWRALQALDEDAKPRTLAKWLDLARQDDGEATPQPYDYARIDAHARNIPEAMANDIPTLAAALAAGARNDREKARAIYIWIADHLAYDVDNVATLSFEQRPPIVVKKRCTDCGGHSFLFEALGKEMGLSVITVVGKTRDLAVDPLFAASTEQTPEGICYCSHVWNAIELDGKWSLIDVTYGNGRRRENGKLIVDGPTDPSWFLVEPEEMIHTHWPRKAEHQFLDPRLTRDEQAKLPMLHLAGHRLDIGLGFHTKPIITTKNRVVLSLRVPEDRVLFGGIYRNSKRIPGEFVMTQTHPTEPLTEVLARFPEPGTYKLQLYTRKRDDAKARWRKVVEYRVEATGPGDMAMSPALFDKFHAQRSQLIEPLRAKLSPDTQTFRFRVPGAISVVVRNAGKYHSLDRDADLFVGEIPLQRGEVIVAAEFPERRKFYLAIAGYEVE